VAGSLSVSDDTIYRALKKLGSLHVRAPTKAYKQNAEAMDAFKKLEHNHRNLHGAIRDWAPV
jgi:hypothetical protein